MGCLLTPPVCTQSLLDHPDPTGQYGAIDPSFKTYSQLSHHPRSSREPWLVTESQEMVSSLPSYSEAVATLSAEHCQETFKGLEIEVCG